MSLNRKSLAPRTLGESDPGHDEYFKVRVGLV